MPLVYLDNCALQRPLDDQTQFRVRVEAEAVEAILRAAEAGSLSLATSSALRVESSRCHNQSRRDFAIRVLALATHDISTSQEVETLTRIYQQAGVKPLDALHLASAVAAKANFFCTADDRLLRKAVGLNTGATRVVTPLELTALLDL